MLAHASPLNFKVITVTITIISTLPPPPPPPEYITQILTPEVEENTTVDATSAMG